MAYYASIIYLADARPVIVTEELFDLLEQTAEYMDHIHQEEAAAIRDALQYRGTLDKNNPGWNLVAPFIKHICDYIQASENLTDGTELNMDCSWANSKEEARYNAHCRRLIQMEKSGNPHIQMDFEPPCPQ